MKILFILFYLTNSLDGLQINVTTYEDAAVCEHSRLVKQSEAALVGHKCTRMVI